VLRQINFFTLRRRIAVEGEAALPFETRREYFPVGSTAASLPPMVSKGKAAAPSLSEKINLSGY
jgi:hypothetical protein